MNEDSRDIFRLVHADIDERERLGYVTYGGPLLAFNGRDALQDAYEEAIDQAMYLRQAIVERAKVVEALRMCAEALPPDSRARELLGEILGPDPKEWK